LLKPKGYSKSTASSSSKKYQPKINQVNIEVPVEILTLEENFNQTFSAEPSTSETTIKIEIDPSDTQTSLNKRSSFIPAIVTFLYTPPSLETKVSVLRNPKECTLYPDSSPTGSLIYTSYKSEEASPCFPFPPLLYFMSYNDQFPFFTSLLPEEVENSSLRSPEVYENRLFKFRSSSP
jgi:hypothetical protein